MSKKETNYSVSKCFPVVRETVEKLPVGQKVALIKKCYLFTSVRGGKSFCQITLGPKTLLKKTCSRFWSLFTDVLSAVNISSRRFDVGSCEHTSELYRLTKTSSLHCCHDQGGKEKKKKAATKKGPDAIFNSWPTHSKESVHGGSVIGAGKGVVN